MTIQLYDPSNLTGYSKPIEESTNGSLTSYILVDSVDVQSNAANGVLVFVTDALGRTRALTDMNKAVVEAQNYDDYGNALDGLNLQTGKTAWHMPDGRQDRITGLTYHLVRDLDRTYTHWTSQDSSIFGPGTTLDGTLYTYVNGNPIWGRDPSELIALTLGDVQISNGVMLFRAATLLTCVALSTPGEVPVIGQMIRDTNDRISQFADWLEGSANGALGAVSEVAILMMIGGAAIQAAIDAAKDAATLAGNLVRNAAVPLFPVFKRFGPDVFSSVVAAQSATPRWIVLTYNGPNSPKTDANRKSALAGLPPAGVSASGTVLS